MAAAILSLNHEAQDTLTVTNIPQLLPVPKVLVNNQPVRDVEGRVQVRTPAHAFITVGAQPVRMRADGVDPDSGPGMGMLFPAGSTINWLDPLVDFSGLIQRAKFVRAEGSTGNGTLEISYFT